MRKATKRTIGAAVDRAVREISGGRAGHHYLRLHNLEAMVIGEVAGERQQRFSDEEPPGGEIPDAGDLSGIFIVDYSAIDSPSALIV